MNILAGAYDLQGNYGKTGNYEDEYGILINKLALPKNDMLRSRVWVEFMLILEMFLSSVLSM